MSTWKGFIPESKSYLNYATRTRREKFSFWRQVPRAWLHFQWAALRDWIVTG
ncbi:MAG: hypothetical protein GY832_26040 [Chloroflexi bacterium]|nr:hypothetical protein [Chloroflexota bacterium]